jgi:hypothetical protein
MSASERRPRGPSLLGVPDWVDSALGQYYLDLADHKGSYIRLAMPGQFYRSKDGLCNWEAGPRLFGSNLRHSAGESESSKNCRPVSLPPALTLRIYSGRWRAALN